MSVILKDSGNAVIYTFPSGMELIEEPYSARMDTEERVRAHGGVIAGDQKIASRVLIVHGIFQKASQALMETELKSMKKACHTKNLRLYATQNFDEYYNVECRSFHAGHLGMIRTVEVEIEFICVDPFRYYKDETMDPHTVDESPESFTVTNAGDVDVSPVITFTVGAGANITKIKIENTTDSSKYFEYEPASALTSGDEVVIDCQDAACRLNGSDDIAHFSGTFFELKSGNNSIVVTITGTPGTNTCEFKFRKRYL